MYNKVTLVGRLGQDPELRYTQNETPVAKLSLATSESYRDKHKKRQEKTEWHRIIVWGKQAENVSEYLRKGRMILVEGKLQTRSYEKDGEDRYVTEVVAGNVTFLPSGQGNNDTSSGPANTGEEEVPF